MVDTLVQEGYNAKKIFFLKGGLVTVTLHPAGKLIILSVYSHVKVFVSYFGNTFYEACLYQAL